MRKKDTLLIIEKRSETIKYLNLLEIICTSIYLKNLAKEHV